MDYEKEEYQEKIDNKNYLKILSLFCLQLCTVFLISGLLYKFINLEKIFTNNSGKYLLIILMVLLIFIFIIQVKFFLDENEEKLSNNKSPFSLLILFSIDEILIITYILYN